MRCDWTVLHRISLRDIGIGDDKLDGTILTQAFATNDELKLVTGSLCPYHFLVHPSGRVEQLLDITKRGAHAKNYNWCSIGIALIGDFRTETPTSDAMFALQNLAFRIQIPYRFSVILGHDQLPGYNQEKVCPGKNLMDEWNKLVEQTDNVNYNNDHKEY